MASSVSNFKNVFNEPATIANLEHIYETWNQTNDDRIPFREFKKHLENAGLKLDDSKLQSAYQSLSIQFTSTFSTMTKKSWVSGIESTTSDNTLHIIYSHILSGAEYDYQSGRSELKLKVIAQKLKDTTKCPWIERIECMQSLSRQLTSPKLSSSKFHDIFRLHSSGLLKQAKDRRSGVMRVACECVAKLVLRWKDEYLRYAYATMETMLELVRQKIQIVRLSGLAVLTVIVKNCGDHQGTLRMLDILGTTAVSSKFVNLKKDCFDLLHLYLMEQPFALHTENTFWSKLIEFTKLGVNDSAEVRDSALRLLAQIELERPKLTKPIISSMNSQ